MWNGWYMNGSDKISQVFYFPVGLRAWRTSSMNVVFGQMMDSRLNVMASNVFMAIQTVALAEFCFASQTSVCKSPILKNRSHQEVIYPKISL